MVFSRIAWRRRRWFDFLLAEERWAADGLEGTNGMDWAIGREMTDECAMEDD
jgi:hypothetical protein